LNLAIGLPLRNQQELDTLLQQLYDPASPNYRRYLTPEEFTQRFGPAEKDYQAVMDFAKSNGLTVTGTHPNRVVLDVAGTVADIQKVFHLTLRVYRHPTEAREFYAPDVEPSVDLGVPILHVSGLDNYSLPHPNSKLRPAGATANATPNSGTGPGGTYRGSDFRTAYVPGTSLTGTGQTVGLLQFDGFHASDIATYASQAGLPSIPVTVVPIDGGVSTPGTGNGEVCLDIEMVMSMAPGVTNIYVYEAPNPSPWVDLLNAMATHTPLSRQLSCSWGGGPPDATAEGIFKVMAVQGQSFFNATGDSDAFTGSIDFPSDSTNITEVGGTTLTTGSGASYQSETVWNWGSGTGSSGGISTYYPIPAYQQGISMVANQGSTTTRNVPDVALTADNVYVVYNNGGTGTFGGTSCAAPLWAGFTALINQQAAASGQAPVGFLNPAIYAIGKRASYTTAFHDTTTGNNFSSTSPTRFAAVAGYDLCTGWGTPNGTNLINALSAPTPSLVPDSFALIAEGCPNGGVDPAETVTVNFGLRNIGTANTTNLVATLLATDGILSPSGPQTYGVLVTNGTAVTQPFTFTATGSCGGTDVATLQLQDGMADLGTLAFFFRLGQSNATRVFSESFDGVTAPALPAGWASSKSGAQSNWVTSTSARDTIPNSAFSPDPTGQGVNELDSPTITLPAGEAHLSFRHSYNLELSYDGGVLEIKIGGGGWNDILTAGCSFVSGGYVSTLSTSSGNPLGGRSAWTGNSGGFVTTAVNLPASASGQAIQLRWRCGSDNFVGGTGWHVDTVSIINSTFTCCTQSIVSLAGTVAYYPTSYPASGLSATRVGNVTMSLTGDTTLTTNTLADGSYGLTNIPVGGTYCVTPSKADDSSADNGVDAIDQVLIQRHILGRTPDLLDSPYKLLAADVDDSGQIDAIDQVLIQRLILGRSSQFPAGLWRFVPANYVFLDPQNPWNAPSNLWYTNLVADVTHGDFVAIKLGDVNNSWTAPAGAQSLLAKSAQGQQALGQNVLPEVVFAVSQQSAQPGQTVAARVTVNGFSQVTSAQFSLVWDPTVLRYVGTGSYGLTGLGAGCFGTGLTASGKLGFAWYDPEADGVTLADGTVLFRVSFEVIGKVGSVSAVALAGAPTAQVVSVDVTRVAFGAQDGNVSVVGPGVLVTTPGYANGAFRLSVPTEKGRSYVLEFTEALTPAKWTALPAVVGDGTVMVLVNPTATNQHRFYRVRVQ
jgi:hypothetical protein